jgi:phage baseplate assembly protein W
MSYVDFPFHFDPSGRTAQTEVANHVRDLVEQVLFTTPGERVMRPDFGSGLMALVFEPNSDTLAATTQMLVQASLQQHLSHLIVVDGIDVNNEDSSLRVSVTYTLLTDGTRQVANFSAPGA